MLARNALALAALGALIAVTAPGEIEVENAGERTERGPRETRGVSPVKVDLAWVPRVERTLRGVDEDLARIGAAKRAYASLAPGRRSPELRDWMADLARKEVELRRTREVLGRGLEAVRAYEGSRSELDKIKRKLDLVQNARNSMRTL